MLYALPTLSREILLQPANQLIWCSPARLLNSGASVPPDRAARVRANESRARKSSLASSLGEPMATRRQYDTRKQSLAIAWHNVENATSLAAECRRRR